MDRPPSEHIGSGEDPSRAMDRSIDTVTAATFVLRFATGLTGALVVFLLADFSDYGGPEVYNALLYSVDREVRLARSTVAEVYLPLVEDLLGVELRLDRSERRFVSS